MPAALAAIPLYISGAVTTAAAAAGAGLAAQAAISAIVAPLAAIGLSTGLSLAASALLRPEQPKPSGSQQEFKQPIANRKYHYGLVKVSGPLAFWKVGLEGEKKAQFKAVLLSARTIDGFAAHYLNDKEVTVGGVPGFDDWVEDDQYWLDGIPRARIVTHLGAEDQAADALLMEKFDAWTADHRLQGIAYAVCEFVAAGAEKLSSVFPNGEPSYSALIRSSKLYDARKDSTNGGSGSHRLDDPLTWEFSDLAALAVQDLLTWPKNRGGFGFAGERLYWPDFIAKANLSDEDVPLKAGGTEKRYRVATSYDIMAESRTSVLRRLLEAGDFRLYRRFDGRIGLKGGVWEEPDVTLDGGAGQIVDGHIANGIASPELYNELAFRYMSPAHGYVEVDGDPWQDASIEVPGGGFRKQSIDLLQAPSHGQARRLAKLITARDNPPFIGDIARTNLKGLDALGAEAVNLVLPELDTESEQVSGPFWIEGGVRVPGDVTGVGFAVKRARPDRYDWDAASEEGTAPPVPDEIDEELDMWGIGGGDAWGIGDGDVWGIGD